MLERMLECLPQAEQSKMIEQDLGPIEIVCDAPPYHVVRACNLIGFESPEDVCWRRLDHHEARGGWRKLLHLCQRLLGVRPSTESRCACNEEMPELNCFSFTFVMNRTLTYRLGQCPRCRTVFWEDA
jgi:hypothetical protein